MKSRRSVRRRRHRLPFWRRRRNRIVFHVTLLVLLGVGGLVLPDDVRIWLSCGIPVAFLSSIKLWVLYETRRRTPAELEAEVARETERAKYQNARSSSVTAAAKWSHGFFS